jgi:NAD(P)-dependent dehydrogenase (short-subunit alcohol dehydrogenase family)
VTDQRDVPDQPLDVTDPLAAEATLGRLRGRVAIVVGAGQTPGLNIGNGRATALVFAREGAQIFAVDQQLDGAAETVRLIRDAGGTAEAFQADVTDEDAVSAMVAACVARFGHVDVLHNNVGAGLSAGDAPLLVIEPDAFDRVVAVNLKSAVLTCKHVLPLMREQHGGVVLNVSSFAAYSNYPYIAYKTSKAGVIALTQHVAIANAEYGIRANVLVPGLINTPMAVENRIGVLAASREEVIAQRDAQVPLNKKMGTAWDVAHAALFLASDEARYITGVALAIDGGQGLRIG